MNRIRKLFKSNLFILLFLIIINGIAIAAGSLMNTQFNLMILFVIPLSLLWGPIACISILLVAFAYSIITGTINPYTLILIILTFPLNLMVWKLWYTILNRNGYEIPNMGSLYNIIKILAIVLINGIFILAIFGGYVNSVLNLNVFLLLHLNLIATILMIYFVTRFKIPVYTPKMQFRNIMPKKAFTIVLLMGTGLCLIKLLSKEMIFPMLNTVLIILSILIYYLKPYDEEVFKIKENYDLNLFTKGTISIFLVLFVIIVIIQAINYVLISATMEITPFEAIISTLKSANITFIFFMVPTLIYLYILEKNVTSPINKISETISKKIDVREDYYEIEKNLKSLKINNEIKILVDSMLILEDKYLEYEDNLMKVNSEKEKLEVELKLAHDIQESMIPKDFESFNKKLENKFELDAYLNAAYEMAGNFYDYFQIDDENIGFVIGDVDEIGMPASLIMVKAITLIQDYLRYYKNPSKVLYKVNNILYEDNVDNNGISCWLAKLNIKTGKLSFVNAGHEQAFIRRNNGNFESMTNERDDKLAIMKNISFKIHEMKLKKDDVIFLCTNGVTEAENKAHEQYGEERLMENLNKHGNNDLSLIIDNIKDDLDNLCNDNQQNEDKTMFLIRINKDTYDKPNEMEKQYERNVNDKVKSIRLIPELSNLDTLNEFIHDTLESFEVDLIVEETFVNIVNYSICEYIVVNVEYENDLMAIEFIDNGKMFNPLSKEDQEKPKTIEDAEIGGLGIMRIKEMSDDLEYYYTNGENHLKIFKKIE